jgi:TRAP-type C4-dicarboxylate transport system permease small subunit
LSGEREPAGAPAGGQPAPGRAGRFVRGLDWLAAASIALALFLVLVFTVGQVTDRYLVKSTFDAHDQFARIGLVWLTFIGLAVGIRTRSNVRIELLAHFAPPAVVRAANVILDLVVLVVSGIMVVVGARLLEVGAFQAIIGTPLNYDVMYAGMLVGMALLVVFMVLRFADLFSGGHLRLEPPRDDDHRD